MSCTQQKRNNAVKVEGKVLSESMAHRAVLISVLLAISQTPAYTAGPRIRDYPDNI